MENFILDSQSKLIFSDRDTDVQGILDSHANLLSVLNRELVFAQLPNDEIALELYVTLMASDCIPLFLPSDISNEALARLIAEFKPSKIIVNDTQAPNILNYSTVYTSSKYKVLGIIGLQGYTFDECLCLLATTSG